jgi:hypothetical protein
LDAFQRLRREIEAKGGKVKPAKKGIEEFGIEWEREMTKKTKKRNKNE